MKRNRRGRRPEAIEFLKTVIDHPEFEAAWQAIEYSHDTNGLNPLGSIIYARPGMGKTTLAKEYNREYPRYEEEDRTCTPIVMVKGHKRHTDKSILQVILNQLGVPYASRITTIELHESINRNFPKLGVELIVFDEFQETLPENNSYFPSIMRTMKSVSNDTNVPWVLLGTDELEHFLSDPDDQIFRRFVPHRMQPFSLSTPENLENFRGYLSTLETRLPMKCNLSDEHMLLRMFCATSGIPGLIANLLAMLIQRWDGKSYASLEDFSIAFRLALVGSGHNLAWAGNGFDPFDAGITKVRNFAGRI